MQAAIGPRRMANARVGQKNLVTRRWARRGTRPRAPHEQRTKWAFGRSLRPVAFAAALFGAICPELGKGAALLMSFADTEAMQAHLAEISAAVARGAHAVPVLDQAGWHASSRLVIPDNITLLPLPPRSPELNPGKNVWQFMRDWLSNRVSTPKRHRRPLLRGMEQAHRPALAHHVPGIPRLGARVLKNERWS